MKLTTKQWILAVAFVIGFSVFLGSLARFSGFNEILPEASYATSDQFRCMTSDGTYRAIATKSEYEACVDRVNRQYRIGPYTPWWEQHPLPAALLAGGATFFVIAGGARLVFD